MRTCNPDGFALHRPDCSEPTDYGVGARVWSTTLWLCDAEAAGTGPNVHISVPLGSENDKSGGESVHSELIILFVCSESAERPGKEVRHTIYRKIALFTRDQSRNPCPWDRLVHAYWIRHLRDG